MAENTIEAFRFEFRFREPVRIAWKTFLSNEGILCSFGNGFGIGEGLPVKELTGEDRNQAISAIRSVPRQFPQEVPLLDSLEKFHKRAKNSPASSAAVDFAVHDAAGKKEGIEVWKFYSKNRHAAPNAITIFGKGAKETAADVGRTLSKHPQLKVLKIKLLGPGKGDEERCRAVAEAVKKARRKISYIVDCNSGYRDFSAAAGAIETARESLGKLILVEEPVSKRNWELSRQLSRSFDKIPIFLDDSIVSKKDVETAINRDACSGINIKLQKAGGILPALEISRLCQKHSVSVMVGCMFESAIGISAGINFAQSQKNVIVTDLDYDLVLPNVFSERLPFEKGVRRTLGKPGLGVSIDRRKLISARKSRLVRFPNSLLRNLWGRA